MQKIYSDFDLQLLKFIYDSRAVTFEQLAEHFNKTKNVIYKKISKLSKKGLLLTEGTSYIKNSESNFHGKCIFLSSRGISFLKKIDKDINRTADRNKPTKNQLPYVLLANEIKIKLNKTDWLFWDSREAKDFFNRNYNELLNGLIINNESLTHNVAYIFPALSDEKNVLPSEKYFYLFANELIKHYEQMQVSNLSNFNVNKHYIHNYMFFCKSKKWFNLLLDNILQVGEGSFIVRARSVKVFPFNYGINYLSMNGTLNQRITFLSKSLKGRDLNEEFKIDFEELQSIKYFGVEFRVTLKDRYSYLVDLMDFDLKKVQMLKLYTDDEFLKYGSIKIIIVASIVWKEYILRHLTYKYFEFVFID